MAGVRKIRDNPLRYLVTWTHETIMDNCRMSVVEQMHEPPHPSFWWCRTHHDTGCECIIEVKRMRVDIHLDDRD